MILITSRRGERRADPRCWVVADASEASAIVRAVLRAQADRYEVHPSRDTRVLPLRPATCLRCQCPGIGALYHTCGDAGGHEHTGEPRGRE